MFHTSNRYFFSLSLKHGEGKFSIISSSPSPTGHTVGVQRVPQGRDSCTERGPCRALSCWASSSSSQSQNHRLPSFHRFTWAYTWKNPVHYELKEVRSSPAPLALWLIGTVHVPLPWKCAHHFLSHKAVLLLLISTAGERGNILLSAAEQWKSLEEKVWK